ncbi:MAG: ABC transporter permease, partial [Kiloniellales bacterium]
MAAASLPAANRPTFLGLPITPLTARRLHNFRANRRGFWSLWIFLVLFAISLFAELVANDKPLLAYYDGAFYAPVFKDYPETAFGGTFETATEYKDPYVQKLIDDKGWMIWPLIRYD